jgi:hypothetical protein
VRSACVPPDDHVAYVHGRIVVVLLQKLRNLDQLPCLLADVEVFARLGVWKQLINIVQEHCWHGSFAMDTVHPLSLQACLLVDTLPLQALAQACPDDTETALVRGELTLKVLLVGAAIGLLEEAMAEPTLNHTLALKTQGWDGHCVYRRCGDSMKTHKTSKIVLVVRNGMVLWIVKVEALCDIFFILPAIALGWRLALAL